MEKRSDKKEWPKKEVKTWAREPLLTVWCLHSQECRWVVLCHQSSILNNSNLSSSLRALGTIQTKDFEQEDTTQSFLAKLWDMSYKSQMSLILSSCSASLPSHKSTTKIVHPVTVGREIEAESQTKEWMFPQTLEITPWNLECRLREQLPTGSHRCKNVLA